jgi:hypothetical protein
MKRLILAAIVIGALSGFVQQSFADTYHKVDYCKIDKQIYDDSKIIATDNDLRDEMLNDVLAMAIEDKCDTTNW